MCGFFAWAKSRSAANAALTWLPPLAVLALIAWGTLAPVDPLPKYFTLQDKFEHFGAFFLLCGAIAAAAPRWAWPLVVGFAVAAGVGVEVGQALFTLSREPSYKDAAASIIGGLSGVGAWSLLRSGAAGSLRAIRP